MLVVQGNPFPLNTAEVSDRTPEEQDPALIGVTLISPVWNLSIQNFHNRRSLAVQGNISTTSHHLPPVKNTSEIG